MPGLTHALLTEDEGLLLEGLEPTRGDHILALFARGNGDAALCLLQGLPDTVFMFDLFDQDGLLAQHALKKWLFENLDSPTLRAFMGVTHEADAPDRTPLVERALTEIPAQCRAFWQSRRACLLGGAARTDSTSRWSRTLEWFMRMHDRLPRQMRGLVVRLGLSLAPLYFPSEERRHSLGYRQLLQDPGLVLGRLSSRVRLHSSRGQIPYEEFRYLLPQGHDIVRQNLDRVVVLDDLPPTASCNKIYLSNVIDYLSADQFHELLGAVIPVGRKPWTALLNSTYLPTPVHPYLEEGIGQRLYAVDEERTTALRMRDRVGIYPGLTIIVSA